MTMQILTKPKTKEVKIFEFNGEIVSRVIAEINGQDVQILSYDGSPMLTILIGESAEQVHILNMDEYIARMTQGEQP